MLQSTTAARNFMVQHEGWMQTRWGRKVTPWSPEPSSLALEDIAAHLAKMCRFNGACIRFYSVAEHSVLIARKAKPEHKAIALMHDASEAYIADIVRCVKPQLSGYHELEDVLMGAILRKFGLAHQWPMPPEIKELDNRILEDERCQNMAEPPEPWSPRVPLGVKIHCWAPARAEREFLKAAHKYGVV